jgi:hypothetical protein
MDWSATFSWWSVLRRHGGGRSGDADRADMGTAFGLDASFDAFAPSGFDREAASPAAEPWEKRLIRRSGL